MDWKIRTFSSPVICVNPCLSADKILLFFLCYFGGLLKNAIGFYFGTLLATAIIYYSRGSVLEMIKTD
jgi:hypothetical protein